MFKKKPNIKPLSPLRSSDRRKVADQIIADLAIETKTTEDDATQEEKAAATAALTALRTSILPDNALSARFTTTHGPDLKQVSGIVYVGTHPGDDQRVLWFKIENTIYPTVYSLWHNPKIVPLLHTPSFVVQKLQGGADLMIPGLANGPPFPSKAKKGAIVAVASLENPSVPLIVGQCEIDVSSLTQVQGAKGHAVQSISWHGDELWSWSAASKPGRDAPESIEEWLKPDGIDELSSKTETLDLQAQEYENERVGDAPDGVQVTVEEEQEEKKWTTKEIDEAFRTAFIFGVHQHITSGSPPHYGLNFPLNQSFVVGNLIQPFLPIFSKSDSNALQLKKTSWKNIKKFIKSLGQDRLLLVKDWKDEVAILDIDFEDPTFKGFKPTYRPPKKDPVSTTSGPSGTTMSSSSDSSVGQQLRIIQLYRVKDKYAELFGGSDHRGYHTAAEIKNIVSTYVDRENLVSQENRRMVTLNPFIANSIVDGSHPNDKAYLHKGVIPRDAMAEQVLSACSPHYIIWRGAAKPDEHQKPKSGYPPKITITLETRSGNKTVTKVSGLEPYYIQPQPLADELRKVCAGSTSIDKLVGSSDKNPVMEILVQGPQKDAILKALEKRGIDKKWVEFVDKTKKKKK